MRAIRFLETRRLADGRTYESGSVHLLSDASALHFVKRDQAEFYTEVQSDQPVEIELDQDDGQDIQDSTDGDSMEGSSESVEEADGSDLGERPEPFITPASNPTPTRGRPRGRR